MQVIDFELAKKLLAKYKISFPRTVLCITPEEAQKTADIFGYPVFLKIYGNDILHRTEINGVDEAKNKEEAIKMFSKMIKIKGVEGVLIQEKVDGKNLIIGMKRDPQFGPVVMVGIGGIFTEILKDFVLRVAPVSEKEALKMMSELKGYDYLCGKRDKKPINFEKVAKIIVAISELSINQPEIQEIDLNPVISNIKTALAVDFKFII
ncbi:MAG: acetate--CoA ligase family protein [Candidatus Staskawiczbacteria bacterium]|jgi:succinyl-CoA synthetase beta subunit